MQEIHIFNCRLKEKVLEVTSSTVQCYSNKVKPNIVMLLAMALIVKGSIWLLCKAYCLLAVPFPQSGEILSDYTVSSRVREQFLSNELNTSFLGDVLMYRRQCEPFFFLSSVVSAYNIKLYQRVQEEETFSCTNISNY